MAKSKKIKVQPEVAGQAPAQVAPAPAPVPVKAEKAPETAETKWKRRLVRWQGKAEAEGVNTKALMAELAA
jgi:hypothetical protein